MTAGAPTIGGLERLEDYMAGQKKWDVDITGGTISNVTLVDIDGITFDTPLNGASGGTGVANTGKTITLGGSLTTSGAFDSTFTMTAPTTVTFPTSGTLYPVGGALGTPSSGTLTNCTGLPVASVTGLGAGVGTFLATPSSANLAAAVTGETGSGALVFATSPTLVTPALGTPSSGDLTNCTALPVSTGVSGLGAGVAAFLATPSSANLAAAVTGETGSGALVFATSPTLVTPALGTPSSGTLTSCTNLPIVAGTTGTLTETRGGTNQTTYTTGDLLQASASNTLSKLAAVATGNALISGGVGVASSWGKIGLTTHVSGTLPVANGGTNDTGTAWTSWTPTVTAGSGSFTTVSGAGLYKQLGKTIWYQVAVTITTNGTAATNTRVSLPVAAKASTVYTVSGRETGSTGNILQGAIGAVDASTILVTSATNTYVGANGYVLVLTGTYEAA